MTLESKLKAQVDERVERVLIPDFYDDPQEYNIKSLVCANRAIARYVLHRLGKDPIEAIVEGYKLLDSDIDRLTKLRVSREKEKRARVAETESRHFEVVKNIVNKKLVPIVNGKPFEWSDTYEIETEYGTARLNLINEVPGNAGDFIETEGKTFSNLVEKYCSNGFSYQRLAKTDDQRGSAWVYISYRVSGR